MEHEEYGDEPISDGCVPFSRTEQLAEVAVFLFLIVPSLVLSRSLLGMAKVGFSLLAWSTILRDLALVCLILFFLWRNREPVIRLGWTARNVWREVLLGAVLFPPIAFGAGLLEQALYRVGLTVPHGPLPAFLHPHGTAEVVLAVLLVVVVAVAEETIFRGYLILRLGAVTGHLSWAVLLSSAIFAIGHGYEGTAGLATVGVMGIAFALIYLWRRSLVAPMVVHFLQDFVGIVVVASSLGR